MTCVSGIRVETFQDMNEAVAAVFSSIDGQVLPGFAIAINPEKIMKARSDSKIMDTLFSATLPFADGIGVVWVLRSKGAKHAARIPGCEFWMALMHKAGQTQLPVFLVGGKLAVLQKVEAKLLGDWGVSVVGRQDGYFTEEMWVGLIERIKASEAKIVTVAMGSPRQELFISQCRKCYPEAFYMGVGGTYDVFTGTAKRAPNWVCRLNVEWLYRLISNPYRIGRQVVLLRYLGLLIMKKL